MKRLVALVLALMMLCSVAFAAEPEVINFGDFNLTLDPESPGDVYEKADGEILFQVFINYDENGTFHPNINALYLDTVFDVTQEDLDSYAADVLDAAIQSLSENGIAADNAQIMYTSLDNQDGVPAICIMYRFDVDYSKAGYELQATLLTAMAVCSIEGIGTYSFTVTSDNEDDLKAGTDILSTLTWNK